MSPTRSMSYLSIINRLIFYFLRCVVYVCARRPRCACFVVRRREERDNDAEKFFIIGRERERREKRNEFMNSDRDTFCCLTHKVRKCVCVCMCVTAS